jgi:hypothetical protein
MSWITNITSPTPSTGYYGPDGQPSGIKNDGGVFPTPLSLSSGAVGGGSVSGIDSTGIRTGLNAGMDWLAGEAFFLGTGNTASNSAKHIAPYAQGVRTSLRNTAFRAGFNPLDNTFKYSPADNTSSFGMFNISNQKEGGPFAGSKGVDTSSLDLSSDDIPRSNTTFISVGGGQPTEPCVPHTAADLFKCVKQIGSGVDSYFVYYCPHADTTDYPCTLTGLYCGSGYMLPVFSGANYDAITGPIGGDVGNPKSGYWIREGAKTRLGGTSNNTVRSRHNDREYVQTVVSSGDCDCWQPNGTNRQSILAQESHIEAGDGPVAYVHEIREEFTQDELRIDRCGYKILSGLRPVGSGDFGGLCSKTNRGRVQRCNCVWAHKLIYIGTDINAKTGVDCQWYNSQWFYEAPQFDNTGGANPNRGKLYACDESVLPGSQTDGVSTEVLCLEYVTDRSSCGFDDPCLCTEAYNAGPKFIMEWSGAVGSGSDYEDQSDRTQRRCYNTVRTGCLVNLNATEPTVQIGTGDIYVICSGATPYWDSSTCGWMTPIRLANQLPTGADYPDPTTSETGAPWTTNCFTQQTQCYNGTIKNPLEPFESAMVCADTGEPVLTISDRFLHNANSVWIGGSLAPLPDYYGNPHDGSTRNIVTDYRCCQKFSGGGPECWDLLQRGPLYLNKWLHYAVGSSSPNYRADRNWLAVSARFSGVSEDPVTLEQEGQFLTPSGTGNCQWIYDLYHYRCGPEGYTGVGTPWDGIQNDVPESLLSNTSGMLGCPESGAASGYCSGIFNSGAIYAALSYVEYDDGAGHTGCSWVPMHHPVFSGSPSGTGVSDCQWTYYIDFYGGDPPAGPMLSGYPITVPESLIGSGGCA